MGCVPASSGLVTQDAKPVRPGWKSRLLAVSFYLGLAPFLRPFGWRRDDAFVQHHAAQAVATILVLLATLAGGFFFWAVLTYAILYHRELYESLPAIHGWSSPERDAIPHAIALLSWFLIWISGLVLALSGSNRALPLIGRLARRPRFVQLARVGNAVLCVGVIAITALAMHASYLTKQDDQPAAVYMLYDDMGIVPRWVFNLGFYRMTRVATARWGPGNVVVAPLDEHHLRLAMRHGRFVFLACHGSAGFIETPQLWITPPPPAAPQQEKASRCMLVATHEAVRRDEPWTVIPAGESLQLVYNTACDSGVQAELWQEALAPAEVKTFDRLSTVAEHIVWLWFDGPDQVRALE